MVKSEPSAAHVSPGAKVVIFVADLNGTGVVRNAIAIANHLSGADCRVVIAACRADGMLRQELDRRVEVQELIGAAVDRAARPIRLLFSIRSYRSLLRRIRPDVVFSAGNHGHLVTRIAAGAIPGVRTVYRVSNDLDHMKSGRPERGLARIRRRAQFRFIAGGADRLALVSPHLLGHPLLKAVAGKVRVIPNGVNADLVQARAALPCPHPWLQGDNVPTLIAVGRLVEQKNFGTLLEAVAIARRTAPVRLVIVGEGNSTAQEQILGAARALAISEAVDVVPPVENPFAWIARASALALPSWWEGSSNVLLEAMACGTPVVASHTAGNARSVLGYGRYGLLVDPGRADEIAEAILIQIGSQPVLPQERARDFSQSAALEAYGGLVAELLGSSKD